MDIGGKLVHPCPRGYSDAPWRYLSYSADPLTRPTTCPAPSESRLGDSVNILRVRCRNLEEFEEHYMPDVPNGGVFCPTTTELQPGTAVVVEMACDGLPNKVLIRGTVTAWRPALPRMRVRAGATVAFEADEAG